MKFHNHFATWCHIGSLPWHCMISFATIPSHRSRRCVGRKGRVGLSWFWPSKTFDRASLSILREVFPCWNPNNLWIWNATGQSSRKYMPVEHVVKYLLILRLWCFDSEIKVDTQMATVSGRLLPTPLLKDGHDLRCWFQKTPMRFSKLPLLKTATRQFIWSASQLLQLIRSSEPTELRGTETIQWPFIIYFFEKFINSSKFTINSFSFFLKCKHLSLILSFVVFWSLFFRCLGVYGASLKNSKSFLAICNANLQTPHVGLCWRTRWDDIETHWMHDEIHSSLHRTTCKWKWIKINCMTHRSLETNELPEEWCQLVGGTVCAEVQYEENQIFAAKSGGMAAGGGKIVHWHAEMTWRVSHFWENMLELE